MSAIVDTVIETLKFIFPAYCANAVPVLVGGGRPLDLSKTFLNGKPVFGRNKTFRGFFAGLAAGTIVGFVENILFQSSIASGFALSLGALCGDLVGAFLKRRMGFPPGAPFPVLDQLDFILGALLFSIPISSPPLSLALTILIITPPIHFLTNFLAYLLGIKKKPW